MKILILGDVMGISGRNAIEANIKNIIKEKQIQKYIESFTSKRKDSNDYIQAVNFLKTYFDDSNKKRIEL